MSFFQQVGLALGNNIIVKQQMDSTQADIDLKQQQVASGKLAALSQQRELDTTEKIGRFITDSQAVDKSTVDNPTKTAELYGKASQMALQSGSWEKAKQLSTLAKGSLDQAKEAGEVVERKIHVARETLANSALDYITQPTPEGAATIAKHAVAAGIDPLTIPPPTGDGFKSWVRNQSQIASTSKDRLAATEKVREFDTQEARRSENEAARIADRLEANRSTALYREGLLDARKASLEASKSKGQEAREFTQVSALIKTAQKEAAPYLKDREVLTSVKNFLSDDSAVADQQIQQALPSLMGSLKGRATNPYYKDNKYYGSLSDKVTELASRTFSGRYSEETRQEIFRMLDQTEKVLLDPVITRIEAQAKKQGAKFGLDPDKIELQGDFNRLDVGGKPMASNGQATGVNAIPTGRPSSLQVPTPALEDDYTRATNDLIGLKREIALVSKQSNSAGRLDILQQEVRKATAQQATAAARQTATSGQQPLPGPAAAALPEGVSRVKIINGVTYHQKGTQWLAQ